MICCTSCGIDVRASLVSCAACAAGVARTMPAASTAAAILRMGDWMEKNWLRKMDSRSYLNRVPLSMKPKLGCAKSLPRPDIYCFAKHRPDQELPESALNAWTCRICEGCPRRSLVCTTFAAETILGCGAAIPPATAA